MRVPVWASVAGATVAASGALWSFLIEGSPRATGPLEDPNDLAYVLVSAVPLLLALWLRRPRRDGRERAPGPRRCWSGCCWCCSCWGRR